ncbi:unnamed protein product [Caenorhabditis bovis]|uniref:AB hydrolase-1 domain-containing protein n=1 Tax=Caenorhabditis bovis TaxID=2654633 RepID=A0A8S1FDU2_9PELO|nr:unnamed protein product [Caenorhabditis bovis]
MSLFADIFKLVYATYRQYLYTSLAIIGLVWKRLTEGDDYFREYTYPKPDCLTYGWNHKYVQLKNVRMHYVDEGDVDSSDDVLLMVHGFPEFWYSWRFQLNGLKHAFRCIAIDMRGYNETDKPTTTSDYNLKFLIEDIREFIDKLGLRRVVLVAHDWGAIVSWRFTMLYPEMVHKLIILNVPHPAAFFKVYTESKEQRAKSWYIYLFQSSTIPELAMRVNRMAMLEKMFRGRKAGIRNSNNFTDEDMLAWKHVFSQKHAITGPLNYYREMFNAPTIASEKMRIRPPVLIIWGERDAFLDKRGAIESVDYCRYARVHLIPTASHWVQQDEPTLVNHLIEEFVRDDVDRVNYRIIRELEKSKI